MTASRAAASWQRRSDVAAEPGTLGAPGLGLIHARILLVDDDARNISLLRRVLERAGFSRLADTTDPLEAAALCERFTPDLICLDLHMSPLDGFGVLEQLVPLIPPTCHLPILMLTSDSSREAKQRALALGAKDFVTKPFDADEVILRIHDALREIERQAGVLFGPFLAKEFMRLPHPELI